MDEMWHNLRINTKQRYKYLSVANIEKKIKEDFVVDLGMCKDGVLANR